MQGPTNETVGELFHLDKLQAARNRTLEILLEVAAQIRPGMVEGDAKKILQLTQEKFGAPKSWHPPQIRFGENTLLPFGVKGVENVPLKRDDIYFLDIGPILDGHEGDVGRAFTLGDSSELQQCCADVEAIWHEVRNHWEQSRVSGEQLYKFAENCAQKRGWILSLQKANGHRISDFPHAAKIRGSIEGFVETPAPNRWILEIQICHPTKSFGAFYEDLLA